MMKIWIVANLARVSRDTAYHRQDNYFDDALEILPSSRNLGSTPPSFLLSFSFSRLCRRIIRIEISDRAASGYATSISRAQAFALNDPGRDKPATDETARRERLN